MKSAMIFACLLSLSLLAVAQQDPESLVIGRKFTLHSRVLNEERPCWVYLPASYEAGAAAGRSYPVLYLLDGRAHFNALTGIVHHLSSDASAAWRIPELIVVAPVNTHRTRDFTPTHVTSGLYSRDSGGSTAFLRFVKEELIPHVESRYRTLPERILVGHSLGGLLAAGAFIDQPMLFRHYIAIDPSLWWDDEILVNRLRRQPAGKIAEPVSIFIAMANSPPPPSDMAAKRRHEDAIRRFQSILQERRNASMRVQYRYFQDETHFSVPLIAMYEGLLFAYAGYERPASVPARTP